MILKMLHHRKKCLHRAIESLGKYGLVEVEITPSSEERIVKNLLNLSDALQVELERMVLNCKCALSKFTSHLKEETESRTQPSRTRPQSAHGHAAPSECNHQRSIGLTITDIQVYIPTILLLGKSVI